MKTFTLKRCQLVKKPLNEVFSFISKPENLELLTPKYLGFHILTPFPLTMKEGAIIDYIIKIGGLPVRWTTMITCYEPPYRFVDLQLIGPYSFWHHTHTFSEADDGTIISDEVKYIVPFGVFGRFAHALFVRRQLESIFALRGCMNEQFSPKIRIREFNKRSFHFIKGQMHDHTLCLRELAKERCIDPWTLARWERGKSKPRGKLKHRIDSFLKFSSG